MIHSKEDFKFIFKYIEIPAKNMGLYISGLGKHAGPDGLLLVYLRTGIYYEEAQYCELHQT